MSAEDELFETPAAQITIQADPDEEPVDLAEMQAEVAKPKRKKRELTPEQREALLERLRKGRETAQKNRRARAEEKRKVKAEAKTAKPVKMSPVRPEGVHRPSPSTSHNSEMFAEVKALRAELAEMRADKAENRRRKAEERLKRAQVKFEDPKPEPKPEPPTPSTQAAKVKDLKPASAPQPPAPAEPTYEEYYCANTGKVKRRLKRK